MRINIEVPIKTETIDFRYDWIEENNVFYVTRNEEKLLEIPYKNEQEAEMYFEAFLAGVDSILDNYALVEMDENDE